MNVSVIIPLFNRKGLICYTLDSLRAEHHKDVSLEVIVVDDGSTDGAYGYVQQEYPWVKLYRNPKKGAPSARNFGLSIAQSEYVHFLDSDDLVESGFYLERLSVLYEDQSLGASYGPWLTFEGMGGFDLGRIRPAFKPYPLLDSLDSLIHLSNLLEGWYLHPSSLVFRKEKLKEVNGYNELLVINQDVDLLFRLLVHGLKIQSVAMPNSLVREHDYGRVGRVDKTDIAKMRAIYQLRNEFVETLEIKGLLSHKNKQALGGYCFYRFVEYYDSDRGLANDFYKLNQELYPDYKIKGGVILTLIAQIVGNRNAAVFKKYISK